MFKGVYVRERQMVKWSAVESVEKAGDKIAMFMFPIVKEAEAITLEDNSEFSSKFFTAFKKRASGYSDQEKILLSSFTEKDNGFFIFVKNINHDFLTACKTGDRISCIGNSAQKKFLKKKPDFNKIWVNMYRLSKNQAIVFYNYKNLKKI